VSYWSTEQTSSLVLQGAADVKTVQDLARLLRQLRRREARREGETQLTYRELAAKTGWSRGVIGEYFGGHILPPTDRFDTLIRLLGATPAEQGALATARDLVEERRRTDGVPAVTRSAVPRQLPPALPGFVGRVAQLAAMDALVSMPGRPPVVAISALSGTAGVGKTTLAVCWAHRVAARFPDGQLYVNLRGFDPTGTAMSPAEAIRGFLEALDVPSHGVPTSLAAQVGLYRSLLANRRVLVILDNARDVEQIRPLLPGSPTCLAVVTSRVQLSGLVATEGAEPVPVDLLTPAEARELLARRLGTARVAGEPDAVNEIVERCARLPLALAVVAARAAAHPGFPLTTLAAELGEAFSGRPGVGSDEAQGRLNAFDGGDPATDVRAVFSWSYRSLTAEAARLFRLLGLHPGPDIGVPAAASLAGVSPAQVRGRLTELARAHLVTEHSPGRFTFHDLLRAYAAELAGSVDTEADRRAALGRVLDHYLHSAHAAALLLQPGRDPILPDPAAAEPFVDDRQALEWFTAEHHVLVAAITHAADLGFDGHAWRLAWSMVDFFLRRGHWLDHAATQEVALAAARRSGDIAGQANAHRDLARAYARIGREDEATCQFRQALELFERLGDPTGKARTHHALASMLERQGFPREALHQAQQAHDLYRTAGHLSGQASTLNGIGWAYALLGDYEQGLACCEQALNLLQRTGDRHGEANTWDSLGYAHHKLGRHGDAVACYQRALEGYRRIGERWEEAETLSRLGDTHFAAGEEEAAHLAWERAAAILDELGHPHADEVRAKLTRDVSDTSVASEP
jgi:tetratricopeptide (TPR) repeat protein